MSCMYVYAKCNEKLIQYSTSNFVFKQNGYIFWKGVYNKWSRSVDHMFLMFLFIVTITDDLIACRKQSIKWS